MARYLLIFSLFLFLCSCNRGESAGGEQVKVGAEILIEDHLDELSGKRVGLVMNSTARVQGMHMLDTLVAHDINITALFAPEHGFRGQAGAGEVIEDGVDQATGLPVYSLYGDSRKPTSEMLEDIDLLLFDMQDVGARYYTYNVTLGLVLEAAAENNIAVWVLDRPNPAGGNYVAGWTLDEKFTSFVGAYPIPMVHGMTLGELARMMVGEQWLDTDMEPDLRIIEMQDWNRSMKWPDTGLEWFPPSPNLPTFEHAFVYLGTVLFEGTDLSEGRGTDDPFLTVGSPNTEITDDQLDSLRKQFPGVSIEPTTFTPVSMPGKAPNPKFEGEECRGVSVSVQNYSQIDPVQFGVELLQVIRANTPGTEIKAFINNLAGIALQSVLTESADYSSVDWQQDVTNFKNRRQSYLLY